MWILRGSKELMSLSMSVFLHKTPGWSNVIKIPIEAGKIQRKAGLHICQHQSHGSEVASLCISSCMGDQINFGRTYSNIKIKISQEDYFSFRGGWINTCIEHQNLDYMDKWIEPKIADMVQFECEKRNRECSFW